MQYEMCSVIISLAIMSSHVNIRFVSRLIRYVKLQRMHLEDIWVHHATLVVSAEKCSTHRCQGLHGCYLRCQHSDSLLSVRRQGPCDCLKFLGWFWHNLSSSSTSHMHKMTSWDLRQGAARPFRACETTWHTAAQHVHTPWAPSSQIKADNSRENK